jgi:DNA-binding FadR family transcriptional regulator
MSYNFDKIINESLKDKFIKYFEKLILSGELKIGDKLPPERELAKKLNISRPIIHEGLVELQKMDLIKIIPRKGTFVNDYLNEGSIYFLESLLRYNDYKLNINLLKDFLEIRILFESYTAKKAAINRTRDNIEKLKKIIENEEKINFEIKDLIKDISYNHPEFINNIKPNNREENNKNLLLLIDLIKNDIKIKNRIFSISSSFADLDFNFHLEISHATKNNIFYLLINSFKNLYKAILIHFYENIFVIEPITKMHNDLFLSILNKDEIKAEKIMNDILNFGEIELKKILKIE